MSQLPDQLLKSSSIPMIVPMNQGMNMQNQFPISPQMPAQSNMVPNPNMPMGTSLDPKSQSNVDTSN
jgi:hypothetical protein